MKKCIGCILICFISLSVLAQKADTSIIENHFIRITKSTTARNYNNLDELERVGSYVEEQFKNYSDTCFRQTYTVNGKNYFNVIGSFGPKDAPRIIIGAHYDVCGDQEGADDNASGVIGLLELARMLDSSKLEKRIDLVAYTLEEPPFFRTKLMGSYIHAASLNTDSIEVEYMMCLEMIAYFKDEKHTQDYPLDFLSLFYGNKGNYITLVKKIGSDRIVKKTCRKIKGASTLKTKKFTGLTSMTGIDFSDHLNYWYFDYPAFMITDTAFYRNKHYHKTTDVMENLDLFRMSQVIDAIFAVL